MFGGNWSDPTGWSGGTVPAAGDTVQLSQALNGPYTVHLDANEGPYAALTVSAANATLALYYGGLTLSVTGATTLSAGDIAIAGNATLDTGTFAESGGFLGMSNGTLDVSGQATLSGGGLGVYGGAFDAGSLAFSGGSFGISGGDVTVTNQVSETAGTAGFYGGTFDAGSLAVSGGSLGMSGGTLDASAALTLSGTGSIGLYNTAATLKAGSLSQTGGSLGMSGGTLAVAGQASFTSGTDVFYGGSTVDAGSLQVGSSSAAHTLTVNGAAFAVSGTASIAAGSTLAMYGGSFSTQSGITDSGTISGAGTVGGPLGGTGTIYAEGGTLDLTGTVASGLSFQIFTATSRLMERPRWPIRSVSLTPTSARDRPLGQPDHRHCRVRPRRHVQTGRWHPHRRAGLQTRQHHHHCWLWHHQRHRVRASLPGARRRSDRRHTDAQRRHLCRQHHTRNSCRRDLLVTGRHPEIPACWRTSWNRAVHLPLQRQRDVAPRHGDCAAILRDERHHSQYERQHERPYPD